MTPRDVDPKEQAFVEQALAGMARAHRWYQARVIITPAAAIGAAVWLAFLPPSRELGVEATILIVMGAMLAAVSAKIQSLIQHNTKLVLQAIAAQRKTAD